MKSNIALAFCLFVISGAVSAKDELNPAVFNLGTLFDFNAVEGHIKTMHITMKDKVGEETYNLNLSVAENGCVQSLNIKDVSQGFLLHLKGNEGELKGSLNRKPVTLKLDEKCNISSSEGATGPLEFINNPNGLTKDVFSKGVKVSSHYYENKINLERSEFYSKGKLSFLVKFKYVDPVSKPMDYSVSGTGTGSVRYASSSKCIYDSKLIPQQCALQVSKIDGKAESTKEFTSFIDVSFY